MLENGKMVSYRTCDLCKHRTNTDLDVILFGDWQIRGVCVHYFCLLLSTHLPQNGQDSAGINGFLVRDIRNEIAAAGKRTCCFCGKLHASIRCRKCKEYFHLVCGYANGCLFQFDGEFASYCNECLPTKQLMPRNFKPPPSYARCSICATQLGKFKLTSVVMAMCCGNGYAHTICMQKYALSAGYYLRCLWCRSKAFRDDVRLRGVFVPDRDAQWEREKGAYKDLHRGHSRCDMQTCLCPKGRDFVSGKWALIICSLCGGSGAHNPMCIPGHEKSKEAVTSFKCSVCTHIESQVSNGGSQSRPTFVDEDVQIDVSVYMVKKCGTPLQLEEGAVETHVFSDDSESSNSVTTVLQCPTYSAAAVHKTASAHTTILKEASHELPSTSAGCDRSALAEANVSPPNELGATVDTTANIALSQPDNAVAIALTPSPTPFKCPPEVSHSQGALSDDGIAQSSVVSSTSQEPFSSFVTFEMYEFDNELVNCLGTVVIRINLAETRFAGKTIDEIQKTKGLLTQDDVIARHDDRGIFAAIDKIINEEIGL